MSRTRYLALPLVLGWLAGSACGGTITGFDDICLHSEGCGGGGGGFGLSALIFQGRITSAATGEPLVGVAVRFEAPARGWSETISTAADGTYWTNGLPKPVAGDCAGLSVTLSRDGYQTLRMVDFPQLNCEPAFYQVNAILTPTP